MSIMNKALLYAIALGLAISAVNCRSAIPEPSPVPDNNLTKYHVIFRSIAYIFKYDNTTPVIYETYREEIPISVKEDEYGLFGGGGLSIGPSMGITNYPGGWDAIKGPDLCPSVNYWIENKISDAGLDFNCSAELLKNKIKEEFRSVKWGDKVSCSVQKDNYLIWLFIQPVLCPGCAECAKEVK